MPAPEPAQPGPPQAPPTPPTPPKAAPAPVRAYRGALADTRGRMILLALIVWILAHAFMSTWIWYRNQILESSGFTGFQTPDSPVWFSSHDLQLGVALFESFSGSFLKSAAWQIAATFLMLAGVVVAMTQRLRIIALVIPTALLLLAALFQCIAYNVYHPYHLQGNPFFTLAFAGICLGVTATLAPRNSGWPELRSMTRALARDAARNPLAQFFGPIFDKEVRVMGRRRGTYLIRAAYPLGLLALLSIVYFAGASEINRTSSGADRLQRLQEIAPVLALFLAWTQYLMLLFLAAALTSSAICDERRTRTLASLMTTPMTATQIVMGKLTSRLAQLLILALISVPFLLGIRVFGGLDAEIIIALVAITMSSTFLMASLGVLASIWSRKAAGATILTVLLFLLLTVAPAVIVIVWAINARGGPPTEIIAFSSPFAMWMVSMEISGGIGGPVIFLDDLTIVNSVVNITLGLMALFIASVSLRGVMLSETALEAPRKAKKVKRARRSAPIPASAPLPVGESAEAPPTEAPVELEPQEVLVERRSVVSDNPVLWRELRQPALGSRRVMIAAVCIVVALVLWLYSEVGPQREQPHMIVGIVGMLLIVLQAAVASTPTVTNEKDSSTWMTLLATPLTATQILIPKLIGSIKKLWFIAAIVAAELVMGLLWGRVNPIVFLHLAMIIFTVGVFLGGTGILFSLIARRTNAASLFNILLAGSLWIGIPLLGMIASEFIFRGASFRGLERAVFLINPVVMAGAAIEASVNNRRGYWSADLPGGNLDIVEFTGLLFVVCLIGCAIGFGAIFMAGRRFNHYSGRSS